MDSRIYFHQYRRPRFANPTYMSNNVNSSLSFFEDKGYQSNIGYNNEFIRKVEQLERKQVFSMGKPNENYSRERYNTINNTYQTPPNNNERYLRGNSFDRSHSNLSSYGSNSLSLNQNDIYNKQNSKFDIITMKPKQFDTSIRQHPKYTLQNKDELYYKRMAEELHRKKMYDEAFKQKKVVNSEINNDSLAGKYTFALQKQRQGLKANMPEQGSKINPEAIEMQFKNYQISSENYKNTKQFTPKLLNHMDELISLS